MEKDTMETVTIKKRHNAQRYSGDRQWRTYTMENWHNGEQKQWRKDIMERSHNVEQTQWRKDTREVTLNVYGYILLYMVM